MPGLLPRARPPALRPRGRAVGIGDRPRRPGPARPSPRRYRRRVLRGLLLALRGPRGTVALGREDAAPCLPPRRDPRAVPARQGGLPRPRSAGDGRLLPGLGGWTGRPRRPRRRAGRAGAHPGVLPPAAARPAVAERPAS